MMKRYNNLFKGLLLFALLVGLMATAQAQLLLPNPYPISVMADPNDIDPEILIRNYTESERNRSSDNCREGTNGRFDCQGVLLYRLNDVSVDADSFLEFNVEVRAGQAPTGEPLGIDFDSGALGNLVDNIVYNIHTNPKAAPAEQTWEAIPNTSFPAPAFFSGGCLVISLGGDLFGSGRFTTRGANPNTQGVGGITYSAGEFIFPNGRFGELPDSTDANFPLNYRLSHADYFPAHRIRCDMSRDTDLPANLALHAVNFAFSSQLGGDSSSVGYAGAADNQFWYFPLDGAPSIIDAELGNAIITRDGNREFYLDLTFSEGIYTDGATDAVTLADFPATMFAAILIDATHHGGQVIPANPGVVIMSNPTRISAPDGTAVAAGSTVVRLFFAADQRSDTLVLDSVATNLRGILISPPTTANIFDADGGALHSGENWNLVVRHDHRAPYIREAIVGPASQHIDVTFNESVKFDIEFNATDPATPTIVNTDPAPADFEVIHYDVSAGTAATLDLSSVSVTEGDITGAGVTGVRLVLPAGDYASEDTFDIRIAEQVKELRFPSLASVFDVSDDVKGSSNFPRTAAPAQVGGLQARGKEQYSIAFTNDTATGGLNDGSIEEVVDSTIASPSVRPEGDTGLVWGILVSRDDAREASEVMLQISLTDGTNTGISFGQKAANGIADDADPTAIANTLPTAIDVTLDFPASTTSVLIVVGMAADAVATTGDREVSLTLVATDANTQEIVSGSGSVVVQSTEDDDEPLVYTASNTAVTVGPNENALQTGNGFVIDSGATVTEAGTAEGVSRIFIQLQLQDDAGAERMITSSFARERVNFAGDNREPLAIDSVLTFSGKMYDVRVFANSAFPTGVTPLPGRGNPLDTGGALVLIADTTAATPEQVQALLRALTFFLTTDDDDTGSVGMMRISLMPPADAGANAIQEETYTLNITPNNDTVATINNETVNEDAGDGTALRFDALTGISAVEASHSIAMDSLQVMIVSNPNNVFASGPTAAFTGGGTATAEVTYTLASNANGDAAFDVRFTDGGESVVRRVMLTVAPIDDPPTLVIASHDPAEIVEGGSAVNIAITANNGPADGTPETGNAGALPTLSITERTGTFTGLGRSGLATISGNNMLVIDPTATTDANGTGTITIQATQSDADGITDSNSSATVEETIEIAILPVNDVPTLVVNGGTPITVAVGGQETLDFTLTDPDWTALSGNNYAGAPGEVVRAESTFVVELCVISGSNCNAPDAAAAGGVDIDINHGGGSIVRDLNDGSIATISGDVPGVESVTRVSSVNFTIDMDNDSAQEGGQLRMEFESIADTGSTANANTQVLRLTAVDDVAMVSFLRFIDLITVETEVEDTYSEQDRRIRVTFTDEGNDGVEVGPQSPQTATLGIDSISLQGDPALTFAITRTGEPTYTEAALQADEQSFYTVSSPPGIAAITDDTPGVVGNIEITMTLMNGGVAQDTIADNLYFSNQLALGAPRNGYVGTTSDGRTAIFTPEDPDAGGSITFAQGIIDRLGFGLTADQNDPGATVVFSIVVRPHTSAPNQTIPAAVEHTINITPVNDPPTGTVIAAARRDTINEDDGAQSSIAILENISFIESGQAFSASAFRAVMVPSPPSDGGTYSDDAAAFFSSEPVFSYDSGTNQLSMAYTVAPNVWGQFNFRISLTDDGGTLNGGEDTAEIPSDYSIVANAINDLPTITAGNTQTINEGTEVVNFRFVNISGGVGEGLRDVGDIDLGASTNTIDEILAAMRGSFRGSGHTADIIVTTSSDPLTTDVLDVGISNIPEDLSGRSQLTITVVDTGGGQLGAAETVRAVQIIEVTPMNDAPVLEGGQVPVDVGATVQLGGNPLNPFNITDPDWTGFAAGNAYGASFDTPAPAIRTGSTVNLTLLQGDTAPAVTGSRGVDLDFDGFSDRGITTVTRDGDGKISGGMIAIAGATLTVTAGTHEAETEVYTLAIDGTNQMVRVTGMRTEPYSGATTDPTPGDFNTQQMSIEVMTADIPSATFISLMSKITASIEMSDEFADGGTAREFQMVLSDSGNDGLVIGDQVAATSQDDFRAFILSSDTPIEFTIENHMPVTVTESISQIASPPAPIAIIADGNGAITLDNMEPPGDDPVELVGVLEVVMELSDGDPAQSDAAQSIGNNVFILIDGVSVSVADLLGGTSTAFPAGFTSIDSVGMGDTGFRLNALTDDDGNGVATFPQTIAAINALQFQLTATQNTPGREAIFTIGVASGGDAINKGLIRQRVTVAIVSTNDLATFNQMAEETTGILEDRNLAYPDGGPPLTIGTYNLVESDQTPTLMITDVRLDNTRVANVDNPNELIANAETVATLLPDFFNFTDPTNGVGALTYRIPINGISDNRYGAISYTLQISDGGTPESLTREHTFTVIVAPVPDDLVFDAGSDNAPTTASTDEGGFVDRRIFSDLRSPELDNIDIQIDTITLRQFGQSSRERILNREGATSSQFNDFVQNFVGGFSHAAGNQPTSGFLYHEIERTNSNAILNPFSTAGANEFIPLSQAVFGVSDGSNGEIPSNAAGTSVSLDLRLANELVNFNGEMVIAMSLQDVPGSDGEQAAPITREITVTFNPRNDPVVLEIPEIVSVNAGTSETFVTAVSDLDVGPFVVTELGIDWPAVSGTPPYFQSGDSVEVAMSAPDDADAAERQNIADENRIVFPDMSGVTVTSSTANGSVTATAMFGASVGAAEAESFLQNIRISVVEGAQYALQRDVLVTVVSSNNDGGSNTPVADVFGGQQTSTMTFTVLGDQVDPIGPSNSGVTADAGDTQVMLTWEAGSDRVEETGNVVASRIIPTILSGGGLSHTLVVTDITDDMVNTQAQQTIASITEAADSASGYELAQADGAPVMASYLLTREQATLIPGRTYRIELSVSDLAENAMIEYAFVEVTMGTALADTDGNGIPDELEGIVSTSTIGAYCGGAQFADSDGDGVSNNVEVALGLECRTGANGGLIAYIGTSAPSLSINVDAARLISGAVEIEFDNGSNYIIAISGRKRVPADISAVTCIGCAPDSLRVFDITNASCESNEARAGGERDTDTGCRLLSEDAVLGLFESTILLIGADELGNEIRVERKVYVAPTVGFEVNTIFLRSTDTAEISLPISIAADGSTPDFAMSGVLISGAGENANVDIRAAAGNPYLFPSRTRAFLPAYVRVGRPVRLDIVGGTFLGIDNTGGSALSAEVVATALADASSAARTDGRTEATGVDVLTALNNELMRLGDAQSAIVESDLTGNLLFALGNRTIDVVAFSPPLGTGGVAFAFDPSLPLFVAEDGTDFPAFQVSSASDDFTEFELEIRRYRVSDDEATNGFAVLTLPGVSTALTTNTMLDLKDVGGNNAIADMIMNGDTIEVRTSASTNGATVEGSFRVTVIEASVTDDDGDGVPDNPSGLDLTDTMGQLQIHNAVGNRHDDVEISGNVPASQISGLAIALGGYAHAAAIQAQTIPVTREARASDYSAVVHSDDLNINPLPGDLEVSNVASGVFDFSIHGLENPGDVVAILIPLLREATQASPIYKFTEQGDWEPFTTAGFDRAYSAAAPCPAISALRQGDDEDFNPASHAWRLATNGVQAGDACLLLQIQDGSLNDADRTVNGVIHDPNALAIGLPRLTPQISYEPANRMLTEDRTTIEVTITTDPMIEDVARLVSLTYEFTASTGTVTIIDSDTPNVDVVVVDGQTATVRLTAAVASVTITVEGDDAPAQITATLIADSGLGGGGIGVGDDDGGGSGAMDPLWLILLALSVAIPYGLRRRMQSNFIRDL